MQVSREQLIWHYLCYAQQLAPDNIAINQYLYRCWPSTVGAYHLMDGIDKRMRRMTKSQFCIYLCELDNGSVEPAVELVRSMRSTDQVSMRMRLPSATTLEKSTIPAPDPQPMRKADILKCLIAQSPRCAVAYRLLADTLENPFERVELFVEYGWEKYNRTQLLERADFFDPVQITDQT